MVGERQCKYKSIRVNSAVMKMQQTGKSDRKNKKIYCKQIKGKQPCRFPEVGLIYIFYDQDLKLSREKHDRYH